MDIDLIGIVIGIAACVCVGSSVIILLQENIALRKNNQDLLNRLMAKNYVEYAQVEMSKAIHAEKAADEPKNILEDQDVYPVN